MKFSMQNAFYIQRTISRVYQKHLGCSFFHVHQKHVGCRPLGLRPDAGTRNLWCEVRDCVSHQPPGDNACSGGLYNCYPHHAVSSSPDICVDNNALFMERGRGEARERRSLPGPRGGRGGPARRSGFLRLDMLSVS